MTGKPFIVMMKKQEGGEINPSEAIYKIGRIVTLLMYNLNYCHRYQSLVKI